MTAPRNDDGRPGSDLRDVAGKAALITGGARGLGRMHALTLGRLGCHLALIDTNSDGLRQAAAEITGFGGQVEIFTGSVDDRAFVADAVDRAAARFGGIDILVNNAGISGQYLAIEEIDATHLTRMFQIHVLGAFNCAAAVIPGMKRRRSGRIINTSSTWGTTGNEISSHYCAAKAALLGATKAWAKELAPYGICVNAIAPGWIDTDKWSPEKRAAEAARIPMQRFGSPAEISELVAFLASPAAGFISGQVISPNGAQTIT